MLALGLFLIQIMCAVSFSIYLINFNGLKKEKKSIDILRAVITQLNYSALSAQELSALKFSNICIIIQLYIIKLHIFFFLTVIIHYVFLNAVIAEIYENILIYFTFDYD